VSGLQDSQEGKLTDTYRRSAVPPGADKKLWLGQQLNSSLEADVVVDVVSHLSKIEGDSFVLNTLVARKKKKKESKAALFLLLTWACKAQLTLHIRSEEVVGDGRCG
jgi:hypothetical protein